MEGINDDKILTKNDALQTIEAISAEIQMGPVDSEMDMLANIRTLLEQHKITPEEAVARARAIEQQRASHYR